MNTRRYTEEFKVEAVRQVVEGGHPVAVVAKRLGVSPYSRYQRRKSCTKPAAERAEALNLDTGNRRLMSELKRVTERSPPVLRTLQK